MIKIEQCPLCSSKVLEKVFDCMDYFSSKETFPVWECKTCGFRFTGIFPSEETIGRYYDSPDYISHTDSKKGVINTLYHAVRKVMLKRKISMIASLVTKRNMNLLDIGCGTGYFLNAAKKQGWTVYGIEKNDKAREKATNHFSLEVKDEEGLYEIKNETFDVITLWHVLEHLEKLNESIQQIGKMIKPDGIVVIAVPNCQSFDAKFYKNKWAAYDVPRHLWHFTPDTMEKILLKHHLQIIQKKRMPLDAFYIALLSEKTKKVGYGKGICEHFSLVYLVLYSPFLIHRIQVHLFILPNE